MKCSTISGHISNVTRNVRTFHASVLLVEDSESSYIISYGAVAKREPWPPHSWGFYITHNDAPQSVGLLWTSDYPDAETSTWQHTTVTTEKQACPWRDSKPHSQRPSGHGPTAWPAKPLDSAAPQCMYFALKTVNVLFTKLCIWNVSNCIPLRRCGTSNRAAIFEIYDMIWYDMIWYDVIYDMIWYMVCCMFQR